MSEVQNKAVRLLVQSEGTLSTSLDLRRKAYLACALDLFYAAGGSKDDALLLLDRHAAAPSLNVDTAVANAMVEIAGISHIHDLDMVQAVYNRLDAELDSAHP